MADELRGRAEEHRGRNNTDTWSQRHVHKFLNTRNAIVDDVVRVLLELGELSELHGALLIRT